MIKGIKILEVDPMGTIIFIEPIYDDDSKQLTPEEAQVFSWNFKDQYEGWLVVRRRGQIDILNIYIYVINSDTKYI